ncbi:MAG: hypothetical protein ACRDJG_01705, partial [Actinomycetota bacterium]
LTLGLALVLGATACNPGARDPGREPEASPGRASPRPTDGRNLYSGPRVQAEPHPFGLKWNWFQMAQLQEHLVRGAGGATFIEVIWCDIERSPGQANWSVVDRVADSTELLGYDLYLKIRTGSCWVNGRNAPQRQAPPVKNPSSLPEDLDRYREFVSALVERYSARGIHTYAVENEVNARNFWEGTPQEYERLAEAAAGSIRAADPSARVLDSGISSGGLGLAVAARMLEKGEAGDALRFYNDYYRRRFLETRSPIMRAGTTSELEAAVGEPIGRRTIDHLEATFRLARRGIFDAYQLHFYEPWSVAPTLLAHIREGIGASLPIEAWEVGVFWPGESYDERAHATETVKLLSTLLAAGVSRLIYLPAAYTPSGARDETFRGLWLPTGEARPAARAYEALVAASSGTAAFWETFEASGLSGIGLQGESGATLVVWSAGEVRLGGAPPSGARATAASGEALEWGPSGLRVGEEPVLVSLPQSLDAALSWLEEAARRAR